MGIEGLKPAVVPFKEPERPAGPDEMEFTQALAALDQLAEDNKDIATLRTTLEQLPADDRSALSHLLNAEGLDWHRFKVDEEDVLRVLAALQTWISAPPTERKRAGRNLAESLSS